MPRLKFLLCYSQKPGAFNTKCVQLIGKCFRDLEKLSIGGYDVDLSSLVFIGKYLHASLSSLIQDELLSSNCLNLHLQMERFARVKYKL